MPTDQAVTTVTNLTTSSTNVEHPMDDLATLAGLDRLIGETSEALRARVWDVYVHKANASFKGLLNGMNRELGFIQERTLNIALRSGIRMEDGPRIDIDQAGITIYSAWGVNVTPVVELTIDIFNEFISPAHDYHARYVSDVVTVINTYSSVFSASLVNSQYTYTLASSLVPTSSVKLSGIELLNSQHSKLSYDKVIPGSVIFSDTRLATEKIFRGADWDTQTAFAVPTVEDEFWVDYDQGYITLGIEDPRSIRTAYLYGDLPLVVRSMPVELYEFTDPGFQDTLFVHEKDSEGEYEQRLLTAKAAGYINELLLTAQHFWGGDVIRNTPMAANDRHTDIVDDLNLSDVSSVAFQSSVQHGYNHTKTKESI